MDRNSQRYIATIAAGARQQSRFIAMMDNYDRTMELVNVAYDSNGKAAEQFGKYSDTLEYKLNKLTNTWEQMRLKFLKSEFLKGAVDSLNELLKKVQNFNIKDILEIATVWLTLGKISIENFVKGLKSGTGLVQKGFSTILQKSLNKVSLWDKISFNGLSTKLADTQNTINSLMGKVNQKFISYNNQELQNSLEKYKQAINDLKREAATVGFSETETEQWVRVNIRERSGMSDDDYQYIQAKLDSSKLQEQVTKQKQRFAELGQAAGNAFMASFTAGFSAIKMGSGPWEAFKTAFVGGATSLVGTVSNSINTAISMGKTALEGFKGGLISGAVSLATTALTAGVTALISWNEELKETAKITRMSSSSISSATLVLKDLEEEHEKLSDQYNKENDKLSEQQSEYDELNSTLESYTEINNKLLLGNEDREELLNIQEQLINLAPDLVDYYDSEGNAILNNTEKLEEYIATKKEELALQKESTLNAKIAQDANEYSQAQIKASQAQSVADTMKDFKKVYDNTKAKDNQSFNQLFFALYDEESQDYYVPDSLDFMEQRGAAISEAIKIANKTLHDEITGGDDNLDGLSFAEKFSDFIKNEDNFVEIIETLDNYYANADKFLNDARVDLEAKEKQINTTINDMIAVQGELNPEFQKYDKNIQDFIVAGTKEKIGITDDVSKFIYEKIAATEEGKDWFTYDEKGVIIDVKPDLDQQSKEKLEKQIAILTEKIGKDSGKYMQQMLDNLKPTDISKIEAIYAQAEEKGWSWLEITNEFTKQFGDNQDILGAVSNRYAEQIEQYNERLKNIATKIGDEAPTEKNDLGILQIDPNTFTGWVSQLSSATQQAINDGVEKASDFGGKEFANQYAKDIQNAISSGQINEEIYSLFNSAVSSENFNIFSIEKTKNQFIKDVEELGYSIEEAEYQWENLYAFSQSYGQIEFGITTTGALEELTEQVESNLDSIVSSYENVSNYISTQMTVGGLNLSEFRKLKEELANISIDVQNFITGMQNGLYQIDFTALTQAYHDQVDNEQITVESVQEQIRARIEVIEALLNENDAQVTMGNNVIDTTTAIWAEAEAMAEVATMAERARLAQEGIDPNEATVFEVTKPTGSIPKLTDTQRDALKEELDYLKSIEHNKEVLTEIANQENAAAAAHAQISNDETEAINKATEANKGAASAAKNAADAADKLREAQEKLNEALYGTENYKNAADHLANYTERLEELTDKANKAKESLEDLGETDSATELLSDYAENVKLENITRTAENQVLQQSTNDLLNILNDKYSEYFQKVGDTWMWNASVVDAQMNDNEKDFIIESIENLNEYQDKIDENLDAIEEREKEFKEMRKTALDSRIALEEEVMDVLKENYQKEIDAAQEKYDALKEADDNYLDALEEAINKQRELRDRANQYEDLAQKERKLALKQRDTSGTNRKDTLQLQKEVEDSRQEMLDNEVDRLLESMKEMYELQQESREAELEYMNAMVENGQLLQEANEIIASFNTREDMLAWFFENNQELADMSVAATEKYKMELEDMYDAAELYYAMSETNLEELTSFTQEEVADTVATIGETLTLEAERSYNEMRETVDKEVEDAKQAVIDAQQAVEDAAAGSASAVSGAAGSMTNAAKTTSTTAQQTIKTIEDVCTSTINAVAAAAYNAKVASGNVTKMENEVYKGGASVSSYVAGVKARMAITETLNTATNNETIYHSTNNNNTYEDQGDIKYKIVIGNDAYYFKSRNDFMKYKKSAPIGSTYAGSIRNGKREWDQFKTGGLVDYTGPAWVDGTPSKPEAFLNSDDTKRIGEAAKLLSNLPILNSTSSASTQLSTNIGDTSIEIHINVDSISSDYDVDRLAERIKSDIVDASKPVGTPVILKR